MKNKKGFVSSQMFVYAFALIVVILIIFAGVKGIQKFFESRNNSALQTLEMRLKSDIESIALKRDAVKEFEYVLPSGFDSLCIFDLENDENLESVILDYYPLIEDALIEKSENIFLLGQNKFYSFRSETIRFREYPFYKCSKVVGGVVSITAKGDVIEGKNFALIQTSNKVEATLPKDVNEETTLTSSDGLYFMEIFEGTTISTPGNNSMITLSISVTGRYADSELYSIEPAGTNFSKNVKVGIYAKRCPNVGTAFYEIGNYSYSSSYCEGKFVVFSVDKI